MINIFNDLIQKIIAHKQSFVVIKTHKLKKVTFNTKKEEEKDNNLLST